MRRFKLICGRILQIIPVLLIVTILAFVLSHVSAGDVASVTLQSREIPVTQENLAAVRQELGLNAPLPLQYLNWLKRAVRFDFGMSVQTHRPVSEEISSRFPATIKLAFAATLLSLFIAVPLAVLSARYRNSPLDNFTRVLSSAGATIPSFWLGLMLLYLFGVKLKIAPVISGSKLSNIFLPAFTLSASNAATYLRVLRSNLLEVTRCDYMTAARARGLGRGATLVRHGLKNALLPMVTLVGINFGKLLGGQIGVETIFSWNGIGKFAVDCMKQKDIPVIQGYIMAVSLAYILINLVLDIIYMFIDPRIESN